MTRLSLPRGDVERTVFEERVSVQERLMVRSKTAVLPQLATPWELAAHTGKRDCALFLAAIGAQQK
jgi:hypothetical protein